MSDLAVGEHLRTLHGPSRIIRIEFSPGIHTVYNIEVETEHCYYVSDNAVLSHNAKGCAAGAFWDDLAPYRGNIRTNGLKGSKARFYQKDYTHGDLEVYNKRGQHLGSADMTTGEMTKPPKPGRKIDL